MKQDNPSITKEQAVIKARERFKDKPQFSALIERSIKSTPGLTWLDQKHHELEWAINLDTLKSEFINIPYFDEELKFFGQAYNIVGGNSRQYSFD